MIRPLNYVLLVVFGFMLAAGGALAMIEGIWAWTGNGFIWIPGHEWLASFRTTAWSDSLVIAISVAVSVAGLVLFVAELRPPRRRVAPFRTDTAGHWLLLRRPVEAHLQRRLAERVAATAIKARLKPEARRWTLVLAARASASTRSALEESARVELAALHAPEASRVRVRGTRATTPPQREAS